MSRHHHAGPPAGTGPGLPLPRPRWWRELALVLLGYWLYTLVRNAVPDQVSVAMQHARQVYRLEQALSLDVELAVNLALDRITWLIVGMNYYYAVAHFLMAVGVLVWLYRRHPGHYRPARTIFLTMNAVALIVFYLYPLAPPRLLLGYGYVDTVVRHGTWGSWASGDVAAASNQYAAMPSMHVGWSLFCAAAILLLARRRWVRVLGVLHPMVTLVVIVATANHFVLDAVGGAAALAAGYGIPRLVRSVRRHRQPGPAPANPDPAAGPDPTAGPGPAAKLNPVAEPDLAPEPDPAPEPAAAPAAAGDGPGGRELVQTG